MAEAQGIPNLGNTCYLNSTLQCLRHACPGFAQLLPITQASEYSKWRSCRSYPLCTALRGVLLSSRSVNVRELLSRISEGFPRGFRVLRQNDAHEFLQLLLERANAEAGVSWGDESESAQGNSQGKAQEPGYAALCRKMERHRHMMIGDKRSPLFEMFAGLYVSQVRCDACGSCFHNGEVLTTLPVPVCSTVREGVHRFFMSEVLEDWKCDRCGKRGNASKCYRTWDAPEILVVMLKRFGVNNRKNSAPVRPCLSLDLADHSVARRLSSTTNGTNGTGSSSSKYALTGTVHHSGSSSNSGHYVAKCLCQDTHWRVFNDSSVSLSNSMSMHAPSQDVYLLFYQKRHC